MGKVQGNDGSIRQPDFIKAHDTSKSKEIDQTELDEARKQELSRRGSEDVSRAVKKPKSNGFLSRVMNFLRGMWSRKPTSPQAVNTQMAGVASQAVGAQKSVDEVKPLPEHPAARPGPGLRPQSAERPNYNAIRSEVGMRPLPIPGQRVADRKNYNAMTPDAMRKAIDEEEALDNLPPPTDMPPSFPDDLPPPTDMPPVWTDDLLPKEVDDEVVVVQARNNDVRLGYLMREIISTEASYLDGLQKFDVILDEVIKKDSKNDKLALLSRDHKAHLAIAKEFSDALGRLKDDEDLNTPEKVIQLYDEELMQRYAASISTLACKFGTNLKVVEEIKKNLQDIYPELGEVAIQDKRSILADKGIILPIQRMPRHEMLTMGMKENAPQNHTEFKAIVDNLQTLTIKINEDRRKSEQRSSIFRRWI